MKHDDKIYISGHRGMVGSAIERVLKSEGYDKLLTRTKSELDLRDSRAVDDFFRDERPDHVILAAAKVGGIKANSEAQADFIYDNLMIECNVIHSARIHGVKKLCYLGSSCIYPRDCPQPIKEEYLLSGPLEPTNEGYAIAKVAGYKFAYHSAKQYGFNAISLMPCNLYGKNDCFDLEKSHVLSALVKRFVDAVKEGRESVTLWGTGSASREFMNVDDLARAVLFLMDNWNEPDIINVGTAEEITIKALAEKIAATTGFQGRVEWDATKPDGTPRKCMDISKLRELGFRHEISLDEGVQSMIEQYRRIKRSETRG